MRQHCHMIQYADLAAVVGDDRREGIGGTQYSGLWSLTSKHRAFNAFGNTYAGLLPGEIRGSNPVLHPIDDRTAVLVRTANEARQSDAVATYRVEYPHYIDHTLTIRDHIDMAIRTTATPFREVAYCCYMNSPEDSRLHFRSNGEWFRYISPKHGIGSHIVPSYVPDSEREILPPQKETDRGWREPFHYDRIDRRFDLPFYYGRVGPMVMILMFDKPRWLRFFCSPSGGGNSILPDKTCPAWDFEWMIPGAQYQLGREYTFRVRLAYKPFVSDEDVLDEYRRAVDELGFEKV